MKGLERLGAEPEGNVELEALAAIAQIRGAKERFFSRPAFRLEFFLRGFDQRLKLGVETRKLPLCAQQNRAREIFDDVADQNAVGGKGSGHSGNDDGGDAEAGGECAGVESACSAEGDESEAARIVPALDRNDANGFLHGGVHDADNAGGELLEGE